MDTDCLVTNHPSQKDKIMKNIILIDLDGTLANVDHRLHHLDKKEWGKFYAESKNDTVNEWCRAIMNGLDNLHYYFIILTARNNVCRKDTLKWLENNEINYDELVMVREEKNFLNDTDLKREWLNGIGLKDRILFVIEDRQRVVDMWRKEGLVCLQCAKWEEK